MLDNSYTIIQHILNSSELPPSFEGNSWIFMSALFCTMLVSLISLTQIYTIIKEMINIPDKIQAPINIYRFQLILAYLTIVMACGPDSVYLWTYNEVSVETTKNILTINRLFDSLFLIPFALFTYLHIRAAPVIKYQLIQRYVTLDLSMLPKGSVIRMNILTGVMIFLMSLGVTLSK